MTLALEQPQPAPSIADQTREIAQLSQDAEKLQARWRALMARTTEAEIAYHNAVMAIAGKLADLIKSHSPDAATPIGGIDGQ